jgi:IS30 family transposase
MGNLSDFEREQIMGARLAGASVTKPATLLGVLRATVSKVVSAHTNHGETTTAKMNNGGSVQQIFFARPENIYSTAQTYSAVQTRSWAETSKRATSNRLINKHSS